jgi:pectate lyase
LGSVKQTSLGLFLGLLASASVLAACGENAISDESDGYGASNGPAPHTGASPAPAGSPAPAPNGSRGTPPANGIPGEGNPPVMTGLDGNNGSPTTPPATMPPETMPPETMPPVTTPPVAVTPGAEEPTDCIIPPAITTPVGYGAGTTGGGHAAPVVVSTYDQAQAVLDDYRAAFEEGTANALVLRYTGTFDFSTITDVCAQHEKEAQILEIKELENLTIEGAPGSSANFGLKVTRAKNIIIRNMTLGLLPGGGSSDAITLEGNDTNGDVENVWVDHNDLFSSTKEDCEGAGDTEFDGLIDIKKGARFITVSYNYLHDHQKTGLLGSSDDDATERYVTFHHNRYENVVSRTPLHRFGYIHMFNNYFGAITSSGINVRMGGVALVEANFFENVRNPITSRYSEGVGFWDLRSNHIGPGITWDVEEDTLANADNWQSTTTFPANELTYAYTPDRAGCVKQIVVAQAGVIR